MELVDKWIRFILRHAVAVVLVTLAVTGLALVVLPRIKIDNSVDVFFDKKSKSYIDFQRWKEQFGSDQVVIVAFQDEDIFTTQNLKRIRRLTGEFSSLKYVDKVTSLTNVNDIVGRDNDFLVEPLIGTIPSSQKELQELRRRALSNPLYTKNIISLDGKTTAIIIELEEGENSDFRKKSVMENVQRILKEESSQGKKYYLSGFTAIEYFYASYMRKDLQKFLPLIFAVLIAILIFSFRNWTGVLLPLATIIIGLVWTMGFLYLCRFSINNVTAIIPPIMLAIAVADSIHLVAEIMYRRGLSVFEDDVASAVKELFVPCMFTSLTTAVGFISLTLSRIPPVRELGIVVSAGVLFAFIITFTFLPAVIILGRRVVLSYSGDVPAMPLAVFSRLLAVIGKFNERFRVAIILVVGGMVGLAVVGIMRIKAETSVIEYFKKSSPIYKSTKFIEDNLSGVHFMNISLKADKKDYFKNPEALKYIAKIQDYLAGIAAVDKTVSVVDYIKEINKSFHNEDVSFYRIPSSKNLVSQYVLIYGADDLDDFVDSRWAWTTVRVRLKEHSTAKLKEIIENIRRYLKGHRFDGVNAEVLGQTVLEVETNNAVTKGQVQSLGLAMLVIFAMMFFVFRSLQAGLVSLVPNLLPLVINFGIMGWAAIRLDSATSMISAIAIGIIVDDTIHFLHQFGKEVRASGDYVKAMYGALGVKGRPIILTSVILCCGFGVVIFSQFVPTMYFGLLSAVLIFNALWADLVVLPAVVLTTKPKF